MDIAFVIHQNIIPAESNFRNYFLSSLISGFDIGMNKSRMALATFGASGDSQIVFDFAQQNPQVLKSKIEELTFKRSKGQLHDALSLAITEIFRSKNGGMVWEDVPRVRRIYF